jgi:hypothetical protein
MMWGFCLAGFCLAIAEGQLAAWQRGGCRMRWAGDDFPHRRPADPRVLRRGGGGVFDQGDSREVARFRIRPQQQELAVAVAEALVKSHPLVAEAGTGVGKSLAYLLPAARFALETGRKGVISTHTINLQEQLGAQGHPDC